MAAISSAHPAIRKERAEAIQAKLNPPKLEGAGAARGFHGKQQMTFSLVTIIPLALKRLKAWSTLTRVMPVRSAKHAMGQFILLQRYHGALTAESLPKRARSVQADGSAWNQQAGACRSGAG